MCVGGQECRASLRHCCFRVWERKTARETAVDYSPVTPPCTLSLRLRFKLSLKQPQDYVLVEANIYILRRRLLGIYNGLPTTTQTQCQDACVPAPVLNKDERERQFPDISVAPVLIYGSGEPLNGLELRKTGKGRCQLCSELPLQLLASGFAWNQPHPLQQGMKHFIHSLGFPGEWLWSFCFMFCFGVFFSVKMNFFQEQEVCGIFGDFLLEKLKRGK